MVPFLAASLVAQLALVAGIALWRGRATGEHAIEVMILPLRSPPRDAAGGAAPPPPPPRAVRAPRRSAEKASVTPLVPPRVLPEQPLPQPEAVPEPSSSDDARGNELGGGPGGAEGGVVGGIPGGVAGGSGNASERPGPGPLVAAPPIPARPRDLEAVRERIARTLRYPPRARDLGWEGRCLVEFVLVSDGAIRHLRVIESSGRPLLDEAALAAVQRATPFPPPGVDVLVRTPIAFRLH